MDKELTPIMKRLEQAFSIVKQLVNKNFYGKVILSIQNGKIINVNVSESFEITE
jgi:hypothetical protein